MATTGGTFGKFSDIPYYVIVDYFNSLISDLKNSTNTYSVSSISLDNRTAPTNFQDTESLDFSDDYTVKFTPTYDVNEGKIIKGCLDAPKHTIYVKGSQHYTEAFSFIDDYGYKPIRIKALDNWVDGNTMTFNIIEKTKTQPGTIIKRSVTENGASFIVYDTSRIPVTDYNISSGDNIYFRKDSPLHSWILSNTKYSKLINPNKFFLYFGVVYPDVDVVGNWKLAFQNLKDFATSRFPSNNMSINLQTYLWIFFDKIYQQVYQSTKNISTLLDSKEILIDFLGYIAKQYKINIDILSLPETQLRDFTANIINLLKRKGTYASLYIIWKVITQLHEQASITVYDRWHSKSITGCPSAYFYDYPYIEMYDFKNDYPITSDDIYPPIESSSNSIIVPKLDFISGNITHTLNSMALDVQFYDINLNRVFPYKLQIVNNSTIYIQFTTQFSGYIFISTCEFLKDIYQNISTLYYDHALNTKNALLNTLDGNGYLYMPENNESIDASNSKISDISIGKLINSYPDFVYTQSSPSYQWRIDHNLEYSGILVEAYDSNYNIIIPKTIEIISNSTVNVIFSQYITGFVAIKKIGDSTSILGDGSTTLPISDGTLSTHYKIEINHNIIPLNDNYIMNEDTMDALMYCWELMRPINRVAHYSQIISPITDFTGNYTSLYNNTVANFFTKFTAITKTLENKYISTYSSAITASTINHKLGSIYPIVQCYDGNLFKIKQKNVMLIDANNTFIDLNNNFTGAIFMCKSNNTYSLTNTTSAIINHNLNTNYPFFEIYTNDGEIEGMQLRSIDENNLEVTFKSPISGNIALAIPEYYYTQSIPSSAWEITHATGCIGNIADIYDSDGNYIEPLNIELKNSNTIIVTFNKEVAGTLILTPIGTPAVKKTAFTTYAYCVLGNAGNRYWNTELNNNVESPIYTINLSNNELIETDKYYRINMFLPKSLNIALNISEIGIFNSDNQMLFYGFGNEVYKHINSDFSIKFEMIKD